MGAKIGGMGFKRNVFISPVHGQGEAVRKRDELIQRVLKDADTVKELARELNHILKPQVYEMIQSAFELYVRAHGVTEESQVKTEWTRFRKILSRKL